MHPAFSIASKHPIIDSAFRGCPEQRLREENRARTALRVLWMAFITVFFNTAPLSVQANPASLITIRSEQSTLPESIQREAYAAIDRSRTTLLSLRDRNDRWILDDGSITIFPALALCDPDSELYADALVLSITASTNEIEQNISKPWSLTHIVEAAYTSLAERMNFEKAFDPRVLARLARTPLASLRSDDAALLLMALDANDRQIQGGWQTVVNHLRLTTESTVAPVAIAALGRLKSRTEAVGKPGNDVLAHARWIARRLGLGLTDACNDKPDPLTPEAAFFVSVFASQIPRQVLAEDRTLLPYDWRNHIANRLIAQQLKDPVTGLDYWDTSASPSPHSDSSIRATTYAVMTLVILAE